MHKHFQDLAIGHCTTVTWKDPQESPIEFTFTPTDLHKYLETILFEFDSQEKDTYTFLVKGPE